MGIYMEEITREDKRNKMMKITMSRTGRAQRAGEDEAKQNKRVRRKRTVSKLKRSNGSWPIGKVGSPSPVNASAFCFVFCFWFVSHIPYLEEGIWITDLDSP